LRTLALAACTIVAIAGGAEIIEGIGQLAFFATSLATAIALFAVRQINRLVYGGIEIAFATLVLWNAAGRSRGITADAGADLAQVHYLEILLQTGTAIYVFIRGLENFKQGLEQRGERRRAGADED
jgi:hypothetical protein